MEKARSWLFSGYAGIPLEITLLSPFWGAKLHSFVMGSSWWAFPGHQVFARGVWLNGSLRRYGKKSSKHGCGITCYNFGGRNFEDPGAIASFSLGRRTGQIPIANALPESKCEKHMFCHGQQQRKSAKSTKVKNGLCVERACTCRKACIEFCKVILVVQTKLLQ